MTRSLSNVGCLLVWAWLGLSATALAHGPTPQKAEERIRIDATPAEVWQVIGDVSALADWQPMLSAVHPSQGNDTIADAVGAERVLVFADGGGEITESIDEYKPDEHYLGYRLLKEDPSVFAVSFYTATIQALPLDSGSEIVWSARFYRGDTGNFPPDDQSDEAAQKAMHGFFKQGLSKLKQTVEGG
ncbi:SRPBCC family protein [Salinisphaera sp. T31B1]|uniref:SRPBCC family protein n=1 Tax=Salinisphaera sp. T31B1 TaxID=727963 RepID=UPI0033410BF6